MKTARPLRVLVTGASSGVGEAIAIASAARGDSPLYLIGRNQERLESVAGRCRALGAEVWPCVIDVRDRAAMREWMLDISKDEPLDRVFANAGVSTGTETEENSRTTFDINVGGTLNTVFPAIETKARQIVITASIAGYGPLKACPAYSATKACLKTWGLSLRGMLRPQGIKVNVVCPGFIRSRITDGNTCPMPFFLEADVAARKILRGVDRDRGLIAFPWPMRLATWFLSCLPQRLNDFVNRLLPEKVI